MVNELSQFPNQIDPLIFFQDLSNANANTYNSYQALIKNNQNAQAVELAHSNGMDIFDATLMNCLQNRIYNIQTYVHQLQRANRHIYTTSDEEASAGYHVLTDNTGDYIVSAQDNDKLKVQEFTNGMIWVSDYTT